MLITDETLMEKFFEDPDSTSEENQHCTRAATIDLSIILMTCGFFIQNKEYQFMLDAVCKYLPSH